MICTAQTRPTLDIYDMVRARRALAARQARMTPAEIELDMVALSAAADQLAAFFTAYDRRYAEQERNNLNVRD
jgi:hypothetical protein